VAGDDFARRRQRGLLSDAEQLDEAKARNNAAESRADGSRGM
jgi:hypothetical protein